MALTMPLAWVRLLSAVMGWATSAGAVKSPKLPSGLTDPPLCPLTVSGDSVGS